MKIALLGGRFDPPHNGHLAVAKSVLRFDPSIDELWFIPIPRHHWKDSVASAKDRLAMVKLLEEGKMKASNYDIVHNNMYAIDTVTQLQETTNDTYVWVCGADTIRDFPRWKDYQALQKKITFLVAARNPYEIRLLPVNFVLIHDGLFQPTQCSSTEIRERVRKQLSIDSLVPEKVVQYIKKKGLYR